MKKKILTLSVFALTTASLMAQISKGNAAVDQAATDIVALYDIIAKLIYAIAAIVALVGAIKIFIAWNSGERDIQKMIIGWFGACIFLVAIGAIITAFFAA